ncbi:ribonucleases P/MRP protein subunit POP1 [Diorhabda carinulata]|uniref:ribonucleases P/MRP protein subunit POP1 n=1 Tax=Diorhabda carinulata TaxID=1163345 RepID=UPI0025A291DB|nr:ribonucleases P/MRP protein subunit POP1 [Diorhabda carinulata]
MSETPTENDDLPQYLTLEKIAIARCREIQVMNKNINTSSGVKLAFQKLPRHMRRRAMSHNVKRLPRRLREIHLSQRKKSGLPLKSKRPSRKYRRRPSNLNSEYSRRQRRINWLQTHIWHAKRFHIVEKWGYKIPYCPCDKSFRACYRATINHCLIQDISYYNCLELSGEFEDIINLFKRLTEPTLNLSIGANAYLGGLREGSTTIFRPDTRRAVGAVYFHWKPPRSDQQMRKIWLWCHAAFHIELLDIFLNNFDFKPSQESDDTKIYFNGTITLITNQWNLSRFRLTGPLSNAVLRNTFKVVKYEPWQPEWVKKYFEETWSEPFCSSHEYWEQLKSAASPNEVSPHLILPLIISDPRYNFPPKRTKSLPIDSNPNGTDIALSKNFSDSPLWCQNVRKELTKTKISTAILNKLRETLLVPGTDLLEPPASFPIILVQRPGAKNAKFRGYGSGWDIILPSVWAQPTWLALIMWGARAGGLRDNDLISFESGSQNNLYPDTIAGEKEENEISLKCKETFFKLPVNKRTNFAKFRICSPFKWNWRMLLMEWSLTCNVVKDFFVLRDRIALKNIRDALVKKYKEKIDLLENCLVPVQITLIKKGLCRQFSIICLPQDRDYVKEPQEPNSNDVYEKQRKTLRKQHKNLLKKLRKKRIRGKKKGKIIPIDKEMLKDYTCTMRKLWLPEPTMIRKSCTREILGFVKHGDFSFLTGKTKAIGYITSGALIKLLTMKCANQVLVRNTNSKQYRFGTLDVILD